MSKKIVIPIIILLIILGLLGWKQLQASPTPVPKEEVARTDNPTDPPQIVSTNPTPLENTIVSATQAIEITFNRPLQNSGEFKLRIEPAQELKIELSSDRKTAKIIPLAPYELGQTYTIFIGPETKFDGIQNWGQEKIYHFKTVPYRGV